MGAAVPAILSDGVTTYRAGRYNVIGSVVGILLLAVGFNGLSLLGVPLWVQPIFKGGRAPGSGRWPVTTARPPGPETYLRFRAPAPVDVAPPPPRLLPLRLLPCDFRRHREHEAGHDCEFSLELFLDPSARRLLVVAGAGGSAEDEFGLEEKFVAWSGSAFYFRDE